MVNEEILGGLKSALERGQSLQMAMMSLFNSGYKKEEIEEAARFLVGGNQGVSIQNYTNIPAQIPVQTYSPPEIKSIPVTPSVVPPEPSQIFSPVTLQQPVQIQGQQIQPSIQLTRPVQKISSYGSPIQKEYKRHRPVIFVLVLLLFFLSLSLVFTFLFKQQVIDYISKFFG